MGDKIKKAAFIADTLRKSIDFGYDFGISDVLEKCSTYEELDRWFYLCYKLKKMTRCADE